MFYEDPSPLTLPSCTLDRRYWHWRVSSTVFIVDTIFHVRFLLCRLPLAGRTLQIFNIETKQKVKSHVNNDDIVFWKWVSDTAIGMVTDTLVYHWTISDATSPQKIFDRHATLAGAQIINYRVTSDEKWLVLIGISRNSGNPSAFKVKGAMQLYSKDRGVSQPIEGHAAAFAEMKLDSNQHPTKLFSFAVQTATGAKVSLVKSSSTLFKTQLRRPAPCCRNWPYCAQSSFCQEGCWRWYETIYCMCVIDLSKDKCSSILTAKRGSKKIPDRPVCGKHKNMMKVKKNRHQTHFVIPMRIGINSWEMIVGRMRWCRNNNTTR